MERKDTDKKSNKSNRSNRFKVLTNNKQDIYDIEFPAQDQVHFIYPTEYLAQLSDLLGRTVDSHMLHLYKDVYGRQFVLERLPLSTEAVKQCKDDMHVFISQLLIGECGLISAILHELMYRINGSNDRNLQILFNTYRVIFYRMADRPNEYEQTMESLEDSRDEFTDEHYYWYYREIGVAMLKEVKYKSALSQFLKAEKLSDNIKVNDASLYVKIAHCLAYMGFANGSIKYLEKAEKLTSEAYINRYRLHIQLLYAINYTNMGEASKSLELLKGLFRDEIDAIKKGGYNPMLYGHFAEAYQELGEYEKAIDNIDNAIRSAKYLKLANEQIYYTYVMAAMLDKIGKSVECRYLLEDGLESESTNQTLDNILLNTLRHCLTLNKAESLEYVENYAIDRLMHYGLNIQAIEYHKKLCTHYSTCNENIGNYKKALYHSLEVNKIRENLSKGGYRT